MDLNLINPKKVEEEVSHEAELLRSSIRKEVAGRLISLKIDKATYMDRHIFGINLHIINGTQFIVKNLGIHKLCANYMIEDLSKIIFDICGIYGIDMEQIYSIIMDNSSNITKIIKFLSDDVKEASDTENEEENIKLKYIMDKADIHDEIDVIYLPSSSIGEKIFSQRCAAYTLQIVVYEALTSPPFKEILDSARNLCLELCCPAISVIIKRNGFRRPLPDKISKTTGWYSTLRMIDSLLPLKMIIDTILKHTELLKQKKNLLFADEGWITLKEISLGLHPAKIATKRFQSEQLVIGDFMAAWLTCKFDTKTISNSLALAVHAAMDKREKEFLSSPQFLSGLALDPRFQVLLTPENRKIAEDYLVELWSRLQKREKPSISTANENNLKHKDVIYKSVEQILRDLDAAANANRDSVEIDIRKLIQEFARTPRISMSSNILIYWEKRRESNPELSQLAKVVLSYPVTQMSIERTYSQLPLVFRLSRNHYTTKMINDIIAVRWNKLYF